MNGPALVVLRVASAVVVTVVALVVLAWALQRRLIYLSGGAAARHEDFVCRAEYARFVAGDLVGSVRENHPGVTEIVLAGLSLSGLAAGYVATRHPAVFRAAVCQSPSFWWERGRFAEELPPQAQPGPESWISVGSRETENGLSHRRRGCGRS